MPEHESDVGEGEYHQVRDWLSSDEWRNAWTAGSVKDISIGGHSRTALAIRAYTQADKARLRAAEWLAASVALALIYTVAAVLPDRRFIFIDAIALTLSLGGGALMARYQVAVARAMRDFAEKLSGISNE